MDNNTEEAVIPHPKCRILCVDDNRDQADIEALLLKVYGFDTQACYDGKSALVEARQYQPDLCIIDLNMPGMDGDELAKRIRKESSDRPPALIALTAMSNETATNRIASAGFDIHLIKPVNPDVFIREVERLCGQLKA